MVIYGHILFSNSRSCERNKQIIDKNVPKTIYCGYNLVILQFIPLLLRAHASKYPSQLMLHSQFSNRYSKTLSDITDIWYNRDYFLTEPSRHQLAYRFVGDHWAKLFTNRTRSQSPWLPTNNTSEQENLLLSYIIPRVLI